MTLNQYKDVMNKCGFVVVEGHIQNDIFYLGCIVYSSYEDDDVIAIYSEEDKTATIYTEVTFDESNGNIYEANRKSIKDADELLEISIKLNKVYKEIEIKRNLLELEKDFKND